MAFAPSDPLTLVAFVVVLLGVCAAFVVGVGVATAKETGDGRRAWGAAARFGVGLVVWLMVVALVVVSRALESKPFPLVPLFLVGCNVAGVALALSPLGRRLALGLPLGALVAFQAFRLPLELVLHGWASTQTVPPTMTWTGSNFDVITGVLALVSAPFVHRSRALAWGFDVVGFALLVNVGRVALLSSPVPFGWNLERPLLLAFHLPYAFIVPVCVAGALAGHVILTRRLLVGEPRP